MMKTNDCILLTGAGFTKNFGGFLSKEMWVQIFNNSEIQDQECLKNILLDEFDFESAYSIIMNHKKISQEEKNSFKRAVEQAYKELDNSIKTYKFNEPNISLKGISALKNLCTGDGLGFFFTLNQDLFIERKLGLRSPGACFKARVYGVGNRNFGRNDFIVLPKENDMQDIKKEFRESNDLC